MFLRTSSIVLVMAALCISAACNSSETGTSGGSTASGVGGGGSSSSGGSGGSSSSGGSGGSGGATTGTGGAPAIGGDRPVTMHVSPKYDPSTPAPLLVLLHGYGASGSIQEDLYFNLKAVTDARGYVYAVPDGTKDKTGKQFWSATDACCNFDPSAVDDSAYLSGVVDEIKAAYTIDPKRVFFVGHSNGGFMSYRMACDHADQIAAIVSLAGATFADDSKCKPSEPVAVAQIHGDADETVTYTGGVFGTVAFPSALTTVELWAAHDGCDAAPTAGPTKDLESSIAGSETSVSIYGSNCKAGGHVELWTIAGGKHVPGLTSTFRTDVIDFLEAHPKP